MAHVQKPLFSTFASKFHPRIEFAVLDVMSYRSRNFNKWVTYSQPILNNFYFASAETAVCELQLENLTPNLSSSIVLDVLKDVKIVEFDGPLLAIYLLRMRRKRPLFYFGLKFDPGIEFPAWNFFYRTWHFGNRAKFSSTFVNFLLHMRRNGHISTSGWKSNARIELSILFSCKTWNFSNYTMFRAIFAQSFTAHAQVRPLFYFRLNF